VLPPSLASCVIYKYQCGQCPAAYIGETKKQLYVRVSQHKRVSYRSGQLITTPVHSKIRNHALELDHPIHEENFKIIDHCQDLDLRILESIYIFNTNPNLNDHASSADLFILR
jgi:hypothetical protein